MMDGWTEDDVFYCYVGLITISAIGYLVLRR